LAIHVHAKDQRKLQGTEPRGLRFIAPTGLLIVIVGRPAIAFIEGFGLRVQLFDEHSIRSEALFSPDRLTLNQRQTGMSRKGRQEATTAGIKRQLRQFA
jgi:hypothetical protein